MNQTEQNRHFKWAAELNDAEPVIFETPEEFKSHLADLEQRGEGELHVFKFYGTKPVRWWQRLLRPSPRSRWDTEPCFTLYWADECATLMFHDEQFSEYRAYDHQHHVDDASEELRIRLNFQEPTPAPPEECLQKPRAFAATLEFINTALRPESLNYRYIP